MKKIKLHLLLCFLIISGCSSSSVEETHYYLLNNQKTSDIESNKVMVKNSIIKSTVLIKMVDLPEYLNQPYLLIQIDKHQLHFSHHHMWAEPLKKGFLKSLTSDLNRKNKQVEFFSQNKFSTFTIKSTLNIQIESFHINDDSTAILAGKYWLQTQDKLISTSYFNLSTRLEQDGYPHAVEKMRILITQLAKEISL